MKYEHISESRIAREGVPIERIRTPERTEFSERYTQGIGKPVIVTDALNGWIASKKWTFEFFHRHYSQKRIIANSPFFLEDLEGLSPIKAELSLGDYLEYILDSNTPPRCQYLQGDWKSLKSNGIPLYAPGYRVFLEHPELRDDITPSLSFLGDFIARLPAYLQNVLERLPSPLHYLFFAAKGAVAFLHTDFWETHAYLAQLVGRKYCILFSPADKRFLYDGAIKDPVYCDRGRFPDFEIATPFVGELRSGELLFIPSNWFHFVVTLEPSMTFSYDFFSESNCGQFLSNFFLSLARSTVQAAEGRSPPGQIELLRWAISESARTIS